MYVGSFYDITQKIGWIAMLFKILFVFIDHLN